MRLTRNTTQWQQTILLLCLLIIAWVLRVRDLGALSIWTDEAFSDAGARRSVLAALAFLLAGCGCRFVFYGPSEKMLGSFQPGAADFLHMRYANDSTAVYEVVNVP